MGKSVQSVKNSLKFKADEKQGLLTIRYGVKKFVVPHAVRMISDGKHMFLSFNASSELYEIKGKNLSSMEKNADAEAAYEALNPSKPKRGGRRARSKVALAPELEAALKSIPTGYKLGYGADGSVKLVKSRTRRKKGA